jgi:predicted ribosomally synthesized peptide with SipW-like signal peptide
MIVGGIVGTTRAYFSDTETSTNNNVIAGDWTNPNWYNFSWYYRVPITITNSSGSTVSNYQLKIILNTQSLITAQKMQSTGADIRFTQSDGQTLINNLWVETINTTQSAIWVLVPSIPTTGTTIYMYYGNTSATTISNPANMSFVFYDDMETSGLSKWTVANGTKTQVTSPTPPNGTDAMELHRTSGTFTATSSSFTAQTDIWETQVQRSNGNIGPDTRFYSGSTMAYNTSGTWTTFFSPYAVQWYKLTFSNVNATAHNYNIYLNESLQKSAAGFNNNSATTLNHIVFTTASTTSDIYIDSVKVWPYYNITASLGTEQ